MTLKVVPAGPRRSRRLARAEVSTPTREVILDTAERLFAERGVDGVALRDLAREMGLTAPSLYNHFSSKQALYDAVLDQGLRPIFDLVMDVWRPDVTRPEHLRSSADRLTAHMSVHPHLARLLQRALLDQPGRFHARLTRWLSPLYREGVAATRESAEAAGWDPAEVPYLAIGLFGLLFSYYVNVPALHSLGAWRGDALSPRALVLQRQFLHKALTRLLAPRLHVAGRPGVLPRRSLGTARKGG